MPVTDLPLCRKDEKHWALHSWDWKKDDDKAARLSDGRGFWPFCPPLPLCGSKMETGAVWGQNAVAHWGGETAEGEDLLLLCPRVAHLLGLQRSHAHIWWSAQGRCPPGCALVMASLLDPNPTFNAGCPKWLIKNVKNGIKPIIQWPL